MKGIILDGREYDVRTIYGTLQRSFRILEGPNSGDSITGRTIRDPIGTKVDYSIRIEPNQYNPEDYDAFYEAISAPVDFHTITFPYGQREMTYDCYITAGTDAYNGKLAGFHRWTGLELEFTAISPQR